MRRTLALLVLIALSGVAWPQTPRRVMVLVFDQMRAEYIDRYDMKNFKRARAKGVEFANGIVGHLESNTIVSHPVITTGKLPRNLPWGTHVVKDVNGWLGEKNQYYKPFELSPQDWDRLHRLSSGDTSLVARVKTATPGPTFAVAQKKYAVLNYAGPYVDSVTYLGSLVDEGAFQGHHRPEGRNLLPSVTAPIGNRFYVEGTNDWGSGGEVYPFHGSSFVTGQDPERPGGDAWVGDVVEKIMSERPEWAVILASFGTIDKVSHVLHEHDTPTEELWAIANGISLKGAAAKADLELGRILDRLEASGLDQETVLVITADHGGQHSRHFHGRTIPKAHQDNLFIGLGHTTKVPPVLKPLHETGVIEAASMNTILSFWTRPMEEGQAEEFRRLLSRTPGVCEVYSKVRRYGRTFYQLDWRSDELKGRELDWAQRHNPELVDTLASETGPDFIGLLFDRHGYDVPGSHGGAQELVQRIPYIVIAPNLRGGVRSEEWARLVDVNPIVGRVLGLPDHPGLDGSYEAIEAYLR